MLCSQIVRKIHLIKIGKNYKSWKFFAFSSSNNLSFSMMVLLLILILNLCTNCLAAADSSCSAVQDLFEKRGVPKLDILKVPQKGELEFLIYSINLCNTLLGNG